MAPAATGDTPDQGDGRLELNAGILVDESVGTGAVGDFAVRGRLFSADLSARARERQEATAERLDVTEALTFEPSAAATDTYEGVRAALFDGYSSTGHSQAGEASEESPALQALVLVAGVPLVILAGVFLGRYWARRRRAVP